MLVPLSHMGAGNSKEDTLALKRISTTIAPFLDQWYGGIDVEDSPREGRKQWLYATIGYSPHELFIRTRNHKVFSLVPPTRPKQGWCPVSRRDDENLDELWGRLSQCEEVSMRVIPLDACRLRLDALGSRYLFQFNRYHPIEDPVPHILPPTGTVPRTFLIPIQRKDPTDWLKAMRLLGTISANGLVTMQLTQDPRADRRSYITAPNGNVFRVTRNPTDPKAKEAFRKFKDDNQCQFSIIYYTSVGIRLAFDAHTVDLFMCHRMPPTHKLIMCNSSSIPGADRSPTYLFGEDKNELPYVMVSMDPSRPFLPDEVR